MHVLIIKMSSMGDVLHTLPALTDAMQAHPDCQFDWVVEPAFAHIPIWHPAVSQVIELPLRQWRKNIFQTIHSGAIKQLISQLKQKKYDLIIDAQGLLKSAVITKFISGNVHGLNKDSAREPLSHYFYSHKHAVDKNQHAVTRTRILFAKALNYPMPSTEADFYITKQKLPPLPTNLTARYLVFCHGTTWTTKHYPESYWRLLAEKANQAGMTTYLPWGSQQEKARADRIAHRLDHIKVLPKLSITEIASILASAHAVVSVDTGLGHLSAALNTPTISLYGATDPKRIGALGRNTTHLSANFQCAPCTQKNCTYQGNVDITPACYTAITPDFIWKTLKIGD